MLAHRIGHYGAFIRNDKALVLLSCSGNEHSITAGRGEDILLADVIAVESSLVYLAYSLHEFRRKFVHRMDGKLHEALLRGALCPHIPYRKEREEIIVRLSPLQETLASLDIFHQFGRITPDAVGRTHIDAGIEFPSRPHIILWRIACAVEIDVIDSCTEHQVEVRLHL